jgi:hypothetical protein
VAEKLVVGDMNEDAFCLTRVDLEVGEVQSAVFS